MTESVPSAKQYKISPGSGIDSGKTVTIVDKSKIKTDGRGVPTNVSGAYKPIDWKKEVAVQFEDGTFGTVPSNRLQTASQRNLTSVQEDAGWDGLDKDQATSVAKGKSEKDKKTMYAVNHEDDGSYSVGEYVKKKSITVFKGGKEMVEEK